MRTNLHTPGVGAPRAWLVGLVALAGALAYLDNLVWVFVVIYAAVLVALLAAVWSWWCGRHLRLFRETREGARVVGQQLVERFTLENDSGLPIRIVEVRDQSRVPGSRATRVVSLAPRQIVTWESTRRLASRGRYELGPTELRVADPFGLFPRRLTQPTRDTLVVYPALVAIPDRSLPVGTGNRSRRRTDSTGGREAMPRRRVPSPSGSSRMPASTDLLILLDLRQLSHRGEGMDSSLEYAVTLAASVAHAAAAHGRAVALATSDQQMGRIPAGRGELHDRNLLDYLATARDDGTLPFSSLVAHEMTGWRGRGGVVLITPDSGPEWVAAAAAAGAPGERALAIFLDPAGFSSLAETKVPAQWRLVIDLWVVHHGDDLSRLDALHGRAVS
ncbi:MAG TPA: hypothetical protein VMV12_09345 [Candidatus Micrarchaeaceae archaeon]|nr:hypothetical protein [Candidatus Micrarchaeaceae archaeon]